MITLKKTIKAGVCAAMRCTNMAAGQLCEKHTAEHVQAGSPPLSVAAPAEPKAGSTALATLPEERQAALVTERHTLQQMLEAAQTFPLVSDEQIAQGQGYLNAAHALAKQLDTEMHSATDPLEAVKKKIRSWFKPNIDTALAIKDTFSRRIGATLAERERARGVALAQIQASAGTAPAAAFEAAHASVSAPSDSGGLVEVRTYELVDFALLPDAYKILMPNHPAIADAVDAGHEIPGVRVTVTQKTRVGRAG